MLALCSGHPSKFIQMSECAMLKNPVENPRATSQTLQASVSMLNVKVPDNTIIKRPNRVESSYLEGESLLKGHGKVEMFAQNTQIHI